jgi:serpin B
MKRAGTIWLLGLLFTTLAVAEETHLQTVVAGNNSFALDLYGHLRGQDGNLFFSPYSISTALAMTYGGARGETAAQMAKTLRFDLSPNKLHPAFAALQADIVAIQQKGKVKLVVANSLWPQEGCLFLPDYLDLCRKYYGTTVTPLDYVKDAESSRETINDWVEDKTNKKITNLIGPGVLDAKTRLILVNAIYFKGDWANPFKAAATKQQPFYVTSAKSVQVPLMHQKDEFGYADRDGIQVLKLPYSGDDLSMVVLLPRKTDGLADLETKLTAQNLTAWIANLHPQEVNVFLPKFKMTSQFSLGDKLAALGMTDAFTDKADFSGMDGQRDLYISAVIHKAFVDVNEEGTEAAATTAVAMRAFAMLKPPPTPVFRADHPFLFLIRENRTGSILFLGRIADPTK